MGWFRDWRRRRYLRQAQWPVAAWHTLTASMPLLARLSEDEAQRLRELALLFLREKVFSGATDYVPPELTRLAIAALACLPVLNLGLDYLDGWRGVIVYPASFLPEHEVMDEAGVVHVGRHTLLGEAWGRGPMLVAADEVMRSGAIDGTNVVIHEIAHKLDMLNGSANGFPPLHNDMAPAAWTAAFSAAFQDFRERVGREPGDAPLNPYGAENPGEFFSVASEAFFETPFALHTAYPDVYAQLAAFYRQDPRKRLAG